MPKRARKILLCATGAYHAYTLPRIILQLLHHFADDVQVVLSRAAARIVSTYAVEVASRHKVFIEMDDTVEHVFVPHIELTRDVDLVLVYPASVSILGKVANGIADELVSALIIAAEVPVIFMPIANPAMNDHPAVVRNVATLRDDGYTVLPPLPAMEVATREGMAEFTGPFPIPTLLMQMRAALGATAGAGHARRG
ncbi:flavoprotein [Sphingomonas antarctica]|uniref:flavoprotein n=1 Tax=Sphingomonas antarctica TaxID=2040274 RepID=UPI0039EBF891